MVSLLLTKVVAKETVAVELEQVAREQLAASLVAKHLLHLDPIQLVKKVAPPTLRLAAVITTPRTTDHKTVTLQWLLPCKLQWGVPHSSSQPRSSQG